METLQLWWSRLGISKKFRLVFFLLTALVFLSTTTTAGLAFLFIRNAEDAIRKSTEIGQQILEMDHGQERSRRLLGEFLLSYRSLGLQKAHEQYAQPSVRQISHVISLSSELEKTLFKSTLKDQSIIKQSDINLYLASAKRFADTSIQAVELISKRAAPERGLEARLHDNTLKLGVAVADISTLKELHIQASSLFQEYLLARQRSLMQSMFNIHNSMLDYIHVQTKLSSAQKELLVALLQSCHTTADELLKTDLALSGKIRDFSLQEEAIRPISKAFIHAAKLNVKQAQQRIDKVYVIARVMVILLALITVGCILIMARILHKSITKNILKLSALANKYGAGNMSVRLQEKSQDELGHLARIFNIMAEKVEDLVKNLEHKVELRTAELTKSEERFRFLVNDLPKIAVQGYDEDRRVIYWNRTSASMYGYSCDEAMGKKIEDLILPDPLTEKIIASFEDWYVKGKEIPPVELLLCDKNGNEVPVYSAKIILDNEPGSKMIYSVDLDLTDLKLAQAMELRIESFYLQLFNYSSSGVAVFEPIDNGNNFLLKAINPIGLNISKFLLEDIIGKPVTEVFPGVVDMGLFDVFQRVFKSGTPEPHPAARYNNRLHSFWFETYVYKVPSGEIVAVYDDVSERKHAEDELQKKTNEWKRTFDAIPDIITLQDSDMNVIRANQATFDFFKMSPEELLGKTCHSLFRESNTPCEECPSGYPNKALQIGHTIQNKSLKKTFAVSLTPISASDTSSLHFVHVAKDITEQLELESKLVQSQKMEAIGSLAGGIAHDFNNILMAIIGFTELAKINIEPENKAQSDLNQILLAAGRAADLVQQILTYSRKKQHQFKNISPYPIAQEALKMLRSSFPSTIELVLNLDKTCGEIIADPIHIHQIIMNICTNALHSIVEQKGTITVQLYRELLFIDPTAPQKPYIILSVTDTGNGMEQSTIDRIFDPYFTTKSVGKGSGLGLAVVHGIVQDIMGFIKVQSTPGEGSTIKVFIPEVDHQTSPLKGLDAPGESFDSIPESRNERILVVDDEAPIVKIHKRHLERHGFEVTDETDSRKALEQITRDPDHFDLLVTDQTMPGLSGAELSQAVLKIRSDMPIIMCTGHSDIISEDDALALGITKYITKPVLANQLVTAVRDVFNVEKTEV